MSNPGTFALDADRLLEENKVLRKDKARLDWLARYVHNWKWDDWMEILRPRDEDGEALEKYIGECITVREAIDAAMRDEDE